MGGNFNLGMNPAAMANQPAGMAYPGAVGTGLTNPTLQQQQMMQYQMLQQQGMGAAGANRMGMGVGMGMNVGAAGLGGFNANANKMGMLGMVNSPQVPPNAAMHTGMSARAVRMVCHILLILAIVVNQAWAVTPHPCRLLNSSRWIPHRLRTRERAASMDEIASVMTIVIHLLVLEKTRTGIVTGRSPSAAAVDHVIRARSAPAPSLRLRVAASISESPAPPIEIDRTRTRFYRPQRLLAR